MKIGTYDNLYIPLGYFKCLFMKWTFCAFLIMFNNRTPHCIIVAFYKAILAIKI